MSTETKIVLKHRKYRGSHPYICHGLGAEKDAACESFSSAVQAAQGMGATRVIVQSEHAPSDAKSIAAKAGIELIVM